MLVATCWTSAAESSRAGKTIHRWASCTCARCYCPMPTRMRCLGKRERSVQQAGRGAGFIVRIGDMKSTSPKR
jgi:hypothetical protein